MNKLIPFVLLALMGCTKEDKSVTYTATCQSCSASYVDGNNTWQRWGLTGTTRIDTVWADSLLYTLDTVNVPATGSRTVDMAWDAQAMMELSTTWTGDTASASLSVNGGTVATGIATQYGAKTILKD